MLFFFLKQNQTSKSEKNSDLINQKYHENMGTYYRTILTV